MESEDLFNSSYVPNNPSLVLDTDLWKTSEIQSEDTSTVLLGKPDDSSPLVQLQPILIEPNINNNDENFFLTAEEGKIFQLLKANFFQKQSFQKSEYEFFLPTTYLGCF